MCSKQRLVHIWLFYLDTYFEEINFSALSPVNEIPFILRDNEGMSVFPKLYYFYAPVTIVRGHNVLPFRLSVRRAFKNIVHSTPSRVFNQ